MKYIIFFLLLTHQLNLQTAISLTMSIKQLFITNVIAEFPVIEMFNIFYTYRIATISQIYYIPIEFQGQLYNHLYITIQNWHKTAVANNFIERLRRTNCSKLLIYDNYYKFSCQVYIFNILNDAAIHSNGYLLTNPIYIEKQLLINKLLNNNKCFDLHDDIKEYLFIDSIYSDAHIIKKGLILNLYQRLIRLEDEDEDGFWKLHYGGYDNIQLYALQCLACGGFKFIQGPEFRNIAPRALCCCPGFREYYLQHLNHPLEL